MTEENRLADKLARLTAGEEKITSDGRRLEAKDASGLLWALAREIDETILPRHLEFRTDTGNAFVLDVANRRLLKLQDISSEDSSEPAQAILQMPIAGHDDTLLETLRKTLATLLANANDLYVKRTVSRESASAEEIGVSATELAQVWGIELYPRVHAADPVKLNEFLDDCAAVSDCMVVIEHNNVTRRQGDDTRCTRLENLLTQEMNGTFSLLGRCFSDSTTPVYLAQANSPEPGTALFLVQGAELHGAIWVAHSKRGELEAAWKRLVVGMKAD